MWTTYCQFQSLASHQLPNLSILHESVFPCWGYTHDRRADKYPCPHDRRADKDSYPHDRNVTDDLCSLIKLCFAFIMVNFSTKCVLWLFMLKIIYFKKCLNHFKKMHNGHWPKREKQVIDHSTGNKNKTMILCICIILLIITFQL